jgi:hypothetical protein
MSLETKMLLAEAVDELNRVTKHLNLALYHIDTANDQKCVDDLVVVRDQVIRFVVSIRSKLDNHRG